MRTRRIYLISHIIISIILALAGYYILKDVYPGHYFTGYFFIPVFFFLTGFSSYYLFGKYPKYNPQQKIKLYLAIKMLKLILSAMVLLIYAVAVRYQVLDFMITFLVYYLAYIVFDTLFLYRFEAKTKKH